MMEVYWSEFLDTPYHRALTAYKAGKTLRQASSEVGRSAFWLMQRMKGQGEVRRGRGRTAAVAKPLSQRNLEIAELRKTMTLDEIGQRYGITRERVRQICAKIDPVLAGKAAFVEKRRTESMARRTRTCARPGCDVVFVVRNQSFSTRHCSHSCATLHFSGTDEQENRDALKARADGWTWDRIGREIFGYDTKGSSPAITALTRVNRWAKRIGLDVDYLHGWRGRSK
jgi:hypothetical protein